MILPGTYTVASRYLPREKDFEVARHQTTVLRFQEIAFVGNTDISGYTIVLQTEAPGGVMKFNDPADDPWGFMLYAEAMDSMTGIVPYTLFAVNPENMAEHYSLYKGAIIINEADDYVPPRTILV